MPKQKDERDDAIAEATKELNKKYREDSVIKGGNIKVDAIPTQSLSLDWVMGCGGFPRGRIVEVYGEASSGKSTMALFIAAQVQKNGGKVCWVDAEQCFDSSYSEKIGVNTKELILNQPLSGEEGFNVIEKMIETNSIDLIVVDSVSALVPQDELDGSIEDKNIALQARLMAKGLRVITGILAKTKTSVIFINQLRDKIGVMSWGPKTTTTGGKALKFYASIRLAVKNGGKIITSSKEVIGSKLKIKAEKNKVGLPFRETEIELYFGKGIDLIEDTLDFAERNGVVKKVGSTYSYRDVKLGVGREKAKEYLEGNKEVLDLIREEILKAVAVVSDTPVAVVEEEETKEE